MAKRKPKPKPPRYRTNFGREIVHRVEEGMDRQQVACTTYQQRNFYTQMRDGFFSRNETFNYVLHHQVAKWARPGDRVLDVCCGRGLLLPLLRYHANQINSYTGLDIHPPNVAWRTKRVTDNKKIDPQDYYPFGTYFVEGNVAEADRLCEEQECPGQFDYIVYTASIEHMHPDDGQASLVALRQLAAPGARMVLTCPNTPPGKDGYDTRYRAHVYEWKLGELQTALKESDWQVQDVWGCDIGVAQLEVAMEQQGLSKLLERARRFVPQEWLVPVLAPLFPIAATEVGILARAAEDQQQLQVGD